MILFDSFLCTFGLTNADDDAMRDHQTRDDNIALCDLY